MVPGVVVVAPDHPLVRPHRPLAGRNDVLRGDGVPVELELQAHRGRSGSDTVGNGQSAAPLRRRDRAFDGVEQRQRIAMADGQRRDRRKRFRLLYVEPLGAGGGGPARRQRIAAI